MSEKLTVSCMCGEWVQIPLIVGDNGTIETDGRLSFSWVCKDCLRTVIVHFIEDEVQFFKNR